MMSLAVGIFVLVIGLVGIFTGPRLARHRVSLHFSYEDLRATSGPRYRRVQATRIGAYVVNGAISVFSIWIALRILGVF